MYIKTMRIAAFDMGTKNFAFCIEEFDPNLSNLKKIVYTEHGIPTAESQETLSQIYGSGKVVTCEKIDLTTETKLPLYLVLTENLNKFNKIWDTVDIFLIEQQMAYGNRKSNIQALRLSQHCLSYFYTIYGNFKHIEEFSSNHKTRILGCPMIMRKKHITRKKFAVELATKILSQRGEHQKELLSKFKKKDDIADCILMIQAFKCIHLNSKTCSK
jgi:hypothetical protein